MYWNPMGGRESGAFEKNPFSGEPNWRSKELTKGAVTRDVENLFQYYGKG